MTLGERRKFILEQMGIRVKALSFELETMTELRDALALSGETDEEVEKSLTEFKALLEKKVNKMGQDAKEEEGDGWAILQAATGMAQWSQWLFQSIRNAFAIESQKNN